MQEAVEGRSVTMRWFVAALSLALLGLVADRACKLFFLKNPAEVFGSDFLFGLVSFHLERNPGIAFGVPVPYGALIIFSILIIIVLVSFAVRAQSAVMTVGAMFVVAGAFSNLFDRIFFGVVIDYIDVQWFTVLNVADVMITLGTVLLGWQLLRAERLDKRNKVG